MGVDPKENVPPVRPWYQDPAGTLNRHQQEKARQMKEVGDKAREAALAGEHRREVERWQAIRSFDVNKPAHQLRKELPFSHDQLWAIVNTPSVDVERRAKILEVLMHRIGETAMWSSDERWKEFRRNSLYALYNDPKVFDHLSRSTEQVHFIPPGLLTGRDHKYPATFLLENTLGDLSDKPGLLNRQRFEDELAKMPADTRGRMMYHLEDAFPAVKGTTPAVCEDFNRVLASQYGRMTDEDKSAFKTGYTQARDTTNFPKDGPNALPK